MFSGLTKKMIVAMTATAILVAMPAVHVAYAASTNIQLPPEYSELLRLAQDRVQAATQPGAYGNGIPVISDTAGVLPWLGVATGAVVAVFVAMKFLLSKMRGDLLVSP